MSKRKRTSTSANDSEDEEREESNSSSCSESGDEEADDAKNVETRDGEEPDAGDVTTPVDAKEIEPRYEVRAIWTAKDPTLCAFDEYPDPTSRKTLAKGTRRFRYLGPSSQLSWRERTDMAQEVARSICLSNWRIKAAEIFVQAPKMRKGEWYLDIATTTQKAYEQLAHAEPSFRSHSFELVSSCAPFPSHHILMRIDGIDVRNGLLAIVNSIKEEVHGCVRIIGYWARFRHRPDDDVPASDDFTGTVYVLGAGNDDKIETEKLPGFLDFKDLQWPKRGGVWYDGRPAECSACNWSVSRHLVRDCEAQCCHSKRCRISSPACSEVVEE